MTGVELFMNVCYAPDRRKAIADLSDLELLTLRRHVCRSCDINGVQGEMNAMVMMEEVARFEEGIRGKTQD